MKTNSGYRLAPSVLAADFLRLGEQVEAIQSAGAHQIHVDVMDGHFVGNISMGPLVVRALRRMARIPLDVHLMITYPTKYFDAFIDAGADHITFHIESEVDPEAAIAHLRERGVGAGLALRPDTPVEPALDFIPKLDMILVMTVYPGFGGQELIPDTLKKIPVIRRREAAVRSASGPSFKLDVQVDGGIHAGNIGIAAAAGANVFVAGSSVFGATDPAAALRDLESRLRDPRA